jgi:geranylgeranyl diphosphate synthase type II
MRYSCEAGGKRIRAVLALAVCDLLGGEQAEALPLACAIELIHAYSLIHDDLPCMDDDDYRRGKPSCHKAFGESLALLAGDALLNLAFEVLLEQRSLTDAARYIAKASGAGGMAGGQAVDLHGNVRSLEQLKQLHALKTGRLIDAAVCAPAILLEAGPAATDALSRYAGGIGLAFQIRDDILDESGTFAQMGKEAGRDAKMHKTTYVSLLGRAAAETYLAEVCREAVDSLAPFGGKAGFLRDTAKFIAEREL